MVLLALVGCAEPGPTVTEAPAPLMADLVAPRAWELVGGTGELPLITWTEGCIPLSYHGEDRCARGLHSDGDVFVQVPADGVPWNSSLAHELLHARLWRATGDGDGDHLARPEWDDETPDLGLVRDVNWTLRVEFDVLAGDDQAPSGVTY